MKLLSASIAAVICLVASSDAMGAWLPDLTVAGATTPPFTLMAGCTPGGSAIVFHLTVSNIGKVASAAIGNTHAVWVADSAKPAWSNGAALPAIAAKGDVKIDVTLPGLAVPSAMWGKHVFNVSVDSGKWIAETSYANNDTTISIDIPKGFCAPSTPVSVASNPNLNVITPAPSPKPTHSGVNPGVMLGPNAHLVGPLPAPINLTQAFTKDVCQAHGGSAGSLACYIGLPAGKLALVWDYPYSDTTDGYNIYRADTAPSGPATVHMMIAPKPLAAQANPSWKFVVLDAQKAGSCFAVTAYHGTTESARSVRLCIGEGGVAKTVSLNPDRIGSMVADFYVWVDKSVQDNMYQNRVPFIRDLLYLDVGYSHNADLFRDQAHTQVSQYTNSLFRGYVHFNTGILNGHQIAQAQLSLPGGTTQGGPSGQLCLAHYGAADHLWNPGDQLNATSQLGNGPYQGPELHLDVTPLVQSWANSPSSNLGITMDGEQGLVIYNMVIVSNTCLTSFPKATLDVTYY
jgi:hypothetical protein